MVDPIPSPTVALAPEQASSALRQFRAERGSP
jgi:hypothetical protein